MAKKTGKKAAKLKVAGGQPLQPETHKKKILVVDDHPVTRRGLSKIINQEYDLMIIGEAEDSVQALEAIKTLKPDMVIADISLKGSSGLELTKTIKAKYPNLPVLVQSMHDETLYGERALQAGAMGYIMKDSSMEILLTAIHKVLSGQIYTSEQMSARLVNKVIHGRTRTSTSPAECLSGREWEVFRLIGEGYSTNKIAGKLNLSIKTIETYRAHIKEKLELMDANEMRQYAIQWVASHSEEELSRNGTPVRCAK